LAEKLAVSHVIIGYDFIFGRDRVGNAELLRKLSTKYGYEFTQVSAVGSDDIIFSSTKFAKCAPR